MIDITFDGRKAQEAEVARTIDYTSFGRCVQGSDAGADRIPRRELGEHLADRGRRTRAGVHGVCGAGHRLTLPLCRAHFSVSSLRSYGFATRAFSSDLHATPISPRHFLAGALFTRMLLLIMQTYVLLLVGIFVSGVDVSPGYADVLA